MQVATLLLCRLRAWYWHRTPSTRRMLRQIPDWLFAVALGYMLAWFAAQGV